jgi:hypothetical protein
MKSARRVRNTLALHVYWLEHPGTNGELNSRVAYTRLRLLDFRLLQCIRTWGIQEGSNGCHYRSLPQDKPWDTLISNIATQSKHYSYVVSRTLTGLGYCDPGQRHQINQLVTPSTVAHHELHATRTWNLTGSN